MVWAVVGIFVSIAAGLLWYYVAMAALPIFFGLVDILVGLCGILGPLGTIYYF